MGFRVAAIHDHGLRFDENLPLYGWLEDLDFCHQLSPFGRIVKNERMTGVHLGVKTARGSGLRLGYSQIANPFYLWRKGTFHLDRALRLVSHNIFANLAKQFRCEPWVDRRGRALGNARALWDLVRGRLHPTRIRELN